MALIAEETWRSGLFRDSKHMYTTDDEPRANEPICDTIMNSMVTRKETAREIIELCQMIVDRIRIISTIRRSDFLRAAADSLIDWRLP